MQPLGWARRPDTYVSKGVDIDTESRRFRVRKTHIHSNIPVPEREATCLAACIPKLIVTRCIGVIIVPHVDSVAILWKTAVQKSGRVASPDTTMLIVTGAGSNFH